MRLGPGSIVLCLTFFAYVIQAKAGILQCRDFFRLENSQIEIFEDHFFRYNMAYSITSVPTIRLKDVLRFYFTNQQSPSKNSLAAEMKLRGLTSQESDLVTALSQSNVIERYMDQQIDLKTTVNELTLLSQNIAKMNLQDFVHIQLLMYTIKHSVDPLERDQLFVFDRFRLHPLLVPKRHQFELILNTINQKKLHYPDIKITEENKLINHIREHTLQGLTKTRPQIVRFLEALKSIAKRDSVMAELLRIFQEKKVTFAIDRPATSRAKILQQKQFLNIHQTDSSRGANRPLTRAHIEAEYIGMNVTDYSTMPNELKPKSMYLIPDADSHIQFDPLYYSSDQQTLEANGDTWVFDRRQIEANTFFIVGDSLNRALLGRDLTDDPHNTNISPDTHFAKNNIQDYALPLDFLATAIPYFYHEVKTNHKFRFVDPHDPEYLRPLQEMKDEMGGLPRWLEMRMNDSGPPGYRKEFFERFPELKEFSELFFSPYENYVEGLFYGALPVQGKVKALIFRGAPPSAIEAQQLRQMGIQIIDGRK